MYPPFVLTVGVNYCKHNREYNGIYQIHHTKIKWIEKLFFEGSPIISVSTCSALSCKSMFCTFGILGTVNIYIRQYIQHSHSFARNQRFIYPIVQSHPATRHSWAVTSYPFSPWCRLRFDQRYFAPRCHIGFLWQKWVRRSPRPALSHLGDWSSRSKAWWSWVEIETTLWDYIVIEVDYSWVDVAVDRFYKYIYIYIYIDIYI